MSNRNRVVFSVSDPTGTSSFLGFDKEVAKLTNVLASEAAQIVVSPFKPIPAFTIACGTQYICNVFTTLAGDWY